MSEHIIRCTTVCFLLWIYQSPTARSNAETLLDKFRYNTVSLFVESCDRRWITHDIHGLKRDLDTTFFGQNIAKEVILSSLQTYRTEKNHKPLVFSFHGWPGIGKSHVTDIILKNWFRRGVKSKYAKKYIAKLDFLDEHKIEQYQEQLRYEIKSKLYWCPKTIFVFEEVDKFPPGLMDVIEPYLRYNPQYHNSDAIFIFISNKGQQEITDIVKEKHGWLYNENLYLSDFEDVLKTVSSGSLYDSSLIDYFVPFLPLKRAHVAQCIKSELIQQRGNPDAIEEATDLILNEMLFETDGYLEFSTEGCRGVNEKVIYVIERAKRRDRLKRSRGEL